MSRATQKKRKLFIYKNILFKKYTRLVRSCELICEASEWTGEWMNSMWWSSVYISLNVHERQFCFQTKQRATATPQRRPNNRDTLFWEQTRRQRVTISFCEFSSPRDGKKRKTMSDSQITNCCHDWENFTFFWKTFFIATQQRCLRNKTRSDLQKPFPSKHSDSKWHRQKLDSSTHFNDTITF